MDNIDLAQLPVEVFDAYFNLTLPKYNELSPTEIGIVHSLALYYPGKFKYKTVLEAAKKTPNLDQKLKPPSKTSPRRTVRKRMLRRYNMRKK